MKRMKRYYTFEEIQNMSEEEVAALNRRALRNLTIFFAIKFGIYWAIGKWARMYYEEHAAAKVQDAIIQKEK